MIFLVLGVLLILALVFGLIAGTSGLKDALMAVGIVLVFGLAIFCLAYGTNQLGV